jgi:hypothetical protein
MVDFAKIERMIFCALCCIVLLTMPACRSSISFEESPPTLTLPRHLVVLPIKNMAEIYGEAANIRSPISGKVFLTGEIAEGACDFLQDLLLRYLEKMDEVTLVPMGTLQGTLSEIFHTEGTANWDRRLAMKAGESLKAEGAIIGNVYRFKQRVGTRYAIESPASVAFEIHLIDVATGRLIWGGDFDETQRALSENLLQLGSFLRRKGQWITAEDMALAGLQEIFQTFP